jgi:hypothetical protein
MHVLLKLAGLFKERIVVPKKVEIPHEVLASHTMIPKPNGE